MGRAVVASGVREEGCVRQAGDQTWLPVVTATTVLAAGLVAARKTGEVHEADDSTSPPRSSSSQEADADAPTASASSSPMAQPAEMTEAARAAIASATPLEARERVNSSTTDDATEPGLTPTPMGVASPNEADATPCADEPLTSAAVPKVLWGDEGKTPDAKAPEAAEKKPAASACWADETSEEEEADNALSPPEEAAKAQAEPKKPVYSSWADECDTDSCDEDLGAPPARGVLVERDTNREERGLSRKTSLPQGGQDRTALWRPKHRQGAPRPPPTACHPLMARQTSSASTVMTLRTAASSASLSAAASSSTLMMAREESTVTVVSKMDPPSPPRTPSRAAAPLTALSSPEPRSPPPLFAMPDTPARTPGGDDRCPPLYPATPGDCPPWRQDPNAVTTTYAEAPPAYHDAPAYDEGYGQNMAASGDYSCTTGEEGTYGTMGASTEWCESGEYGQYGEQGMYGSGNGYDGAYDPSCYDAQGGECGYEYGAEEAYQQGEYGEWQGEYQQAEYDASQMGACAETEAPHVRKVDARWADAAPFYPGADSSSMADPVHPMAKGHGYEDAAYAPPAASDRGGWKGAPGKGKGGRKGGKGVRGEAEYTIRPVERGARGERRAQVAERWGEWREGAAKATPPPSPPTQGDLRNSAWAAEPGFPPAKPSMRVSSKRGGAWEGGGRSTRGGRSRNAAWGGGSSRAFGGKGGRHTAPYPS